MNFHYETLETKGNNKHKMLKVSERIAKVSRIKDIHPSFIQF